MSTTKIKTTLVAVLAALVLALGAGMLATPAFAATANTDGQIHINTTETGHSYKAYQIFKSDTSTDASGNVVHSNVEWGDNVNVDALLAALKADTTIGSSFSGIVTASDVTEDPAKTKTTAAELAKMLADASAVFVADDPTVNSKTRDADTKKLAQIIRSATTGTPATLSADTFDENDPDAQFSGYTSTGIQTGFYLVIDESSPVPANDFASDNILINVPAGTGDNAAQVAPKGAKPTSDKQVQENGTGSIAIKGDGASHYETTADYGVGDTIPFRLTGTLPFDYTDYVSYFYEFTDDMPKGMVLNKKTVNGQEVPDVAVYAVPTTASGSVEYGQLSRLLSNSFQQGDKAFDITNQFTVSGTATTGNGSAASTLTVTANDNQTGTGDDAYNQYLRGISGIDDANWAIVVLYNATLTKDAVEAEYDSEGALVGLKNKSHLTYSSDKNSKGDKRSDTPDKVTTTFTYELDSIKVDQSKESYVVDNENGTYYKKTDGTYTENENDPERDEGDTNKYVKRSFTPLENAKFILVKEEGTAEAKKYYAAIIQNEIVAEWVDITDNYPMDTAAKETAVKGATGADETTTVTEISTPAGGTFNIKGLDATDSSGNTMEPCFYYLHETAAPTGYDKLPQDIKLTITAALQQNSDPNEQKVTSLELNTNSTPQVSDTSAAAAVAATTGVVSQQINNVPGGSLPETGGMGTFAFTVGGIALMLIAAVAFLVRRRNQE